MNRVTTIKCPICESKKVKQHLKCKDHYATSETFELYKCEECKFIFTQNFPNEKEIGKYYNTPTYISHSNTHKGITNSLYHLARKYMLKRKVRLIQRVSHLQEGNILDVGAGTGYFLNAMQEKKWKVEGVEKSEQAREYAQQHFNLTFTKSINEKNLNSDKYDVITLWHVMEHLENLEETWAFLREHLKKSGRLIIALPNCESYDAKYYQKEWAAYDVPRHLWHFSATTFNKLAQREHFKIEAKKPMPLDAFYISILSEKNANHNFSFIRGITQGLKALIKSYKNTDSSSSIIYILSREDIDEKK